MSAEVDPPTVMEFIQRHPEIVTQAVRMPLGTYDSSRFRFYRGVHRWMKVTATVLDQYESAKENARCIGLWHYEDERFAFREYVENPDYYINEAMSLRYKGLIKSERDYYEALSNEEEGEAETYTSLDESVDTDESLN